MVCSYEWALVIYEFQPPLNNVGVNAVFYLLGASVIGRTGESFLKATVVIFMVFLNITGLLCVLMVVIYFWYVLFSLDM